MMKQCLIRILDTFIIEEEISYKDYEDIVVQTLHNFGNNTVDSLIEKLQEYQQAERELQEKT